MKNDTSESFSFLNMAVLLSLGSWMLLGGEEESILLLGLFFVSIPLAAITFALLPMEKLSAPQHFIFWPVWAFTIVLAFSFIKHA